MELDIIKNMQSAPNMGKKFGQDVEPKGTYVLAKTSDYLAYPWVQGKASINKPLIINISDETQISYKQDLANQYKAKGQKLTNKLMSMGYDALITKYQDGSTGEIVLFPNAKFMLDTVNENKSGFKLFLRENLQQADKLYFKSGKLTPQDRELVLSITNGDNYTRLVSDWLYHLTKIWKEDSNSVTVKKFLPDFYQYLKTYDKNVFPVAYNLEDYSALTNDNNKHILELFSCLKERQTTINELNKLPSIGRRNLTSLIRTPQNSEYGFKDISQKLALLNRNIQYLPKNSEKYDSILNKIFNSKNSLKDMVETAEHFVNAFNQYTEDISKEDIIEHLDYIDADLVQNSNNILVIKVNDSEAMQTIGCSSLWCFSRPNSEGFWDDYAGLGYVFVIFDFNRDTDDALFMMVLLPDTDTVYSSTNIPIEDVGEDIEYGYTHLKEIGVDLNKIEKYSTATVNENKTVIKNILRENFVSETKQSPIVAYHGSPKRILKFVDEFVGGEEAADQEGPGIYFTSSFDNAGHYGEYVHKVTLTPRKLLSTKPSSNKLAGLIEKMVLMAPDWEMHAQDYDENPRIGLRKFIQSTIEYNDTEKDVLQQIWYDFYRYKPVDFVRNMVKMGIDGIMVPKENGVIHYIIYNPSIINIDN